MTRAKPTVNAAGVVTGQMVEDAKPVPRWATTEVTDNGKTHYGSGLRGSLCGCHSPTRKERSNRIGVDCPECLKELRKRP